MITAFDPRDPASATFRDAVTAAIDAFLTARATDLGAISPTLDPLHRLAVEFTAGGKRLRPAFCYWGYAATAGQPRSADAGPLLSAAASLDLLHVSALVHDDVMDSSDTRRGVPAAHKQLESSHQRGGGRGSTEAFGRAGAILLGDLLIMWSEQMLAESGLDAVRLRAALPLVQAMRTEVTAGQFLDVVAQSAPATASTAEALEIADRVVEFKSARYTVQRPVQFGAALGGASPDTVDALAAYGSPLGKAFQFRDDLLGIFGDEQLTGKPAGDDLREGKRTVLIAHALAGASSAEAAELDELLGRPDLTDGQIERARRIIDGSGAKDAVEHMIGVGLHEALAALDAIDLTADGRTALVTLAHAAVDRSY